MCRKTYRKDRNINPQDKISLHKKTKIQEKKPVATYETDAPRSAVFTCLHSMCLHFTISLQLSLCTPTWRTSTTPDILMPDCCVFIVIFVVRIIHQYDELLIRSASALHDTAGQQTGRYRHSTYMRKLITDGGPSADSTEREFTEND